MKQIFKFVGYFLMGLTIVLVGFIAYFHLKTNDNISPISIIPENSTVIFESDNFTESLLDISETNYWKSILNSEALKDVKEGLLLFDESLEKNKWLRPIFRNQKLTFSIHQGINYQPEYLIITDIRKYGKLDLIPKLGALYNWKIKTQAIDSSNVYSVHFSKLEQTIHFCKYKNVLVLSSSYNLMEKVLNNNDNVRTNNKNEMVLTAFSKKKLNIYANVNLFQKHILKVNNDFFTGIAFSALGGNFSNETFELTGYSSINDSVPSPFSALRNSSANKRQNEKVIPADAMFYLNFNVDDFGKFYNQFLLQYSKHDPIGYTAYTAGLKLMNSFLGINIRRDFFSWFSGEISVSKLKPMANAQKDDILAVVKVSDIDLAKQKLDEISTKIKNRTSFKFNRIEYKNYEINYLNIRGFFKLFTGNFLNSREKPYYIIIDDCILFSNSSDVLQYSIDNYLSGNTLERSDDFQEYMDNFSSKAQVTSFLNMHHMYKYLSEYSESPNEIKKYESIIKNLGMLGFQIVPEGNLVKTKILSKSIISNHLNEEQYSYSNSAEDLTIEEFEKLDFKIDFLGELDKKDGFTKFYIPHPDNNKDSVLLHEGMLKNGAIVDLWRSYYSSGNIKSVVSYNQGEVNGTCVFYFDNDKHIIRAEVDYNEGLINGLYKEYYANGNIKAAIEFKNGVKWGNISYYYTNGQVKTKGNYRKGKKNGKWLYYSKLGELLTKENW